MLVNRLLSLLSPELYQELEPHLHRVSLAQGQILRCSGERIKQTYFPINCLLSITITTKDGATAETGLVGNRDLLGINAFMGKISSAQTDYIVQVAGEAMCLSADILQQQFEANPKLRDLLLRYTQAFIAQVSQTTACNRLHSLEQRFARWLLEAQDRIGSNHLALTHGFIAEMLGVRRAGVTQAAQKLQEKGLIHYRRGQVQILNQIGLEAGACECFRVVKQEYDQLLSQ